MCGQIVLGTCPGLESELVSSQSSTHQIMQLFGPVSSQSVGWWLFKAGGYLSNIGGVTDNSKNHVKRPGSRVTHLSWFAWGFPGLTSESPISYELS